MLYSVRYQVFVSSTFTDLVEERAEVIQAIWELDCIPTGMEAFVASNESQWEVIRKVIDECDYYVIILGGRYGSLTDDGISYTEKEYRYAKKTGLPILAFMHGSPEEIAVGKTEKVEANRLKLEALRTEIMGAHPVRTWTSATELGGLVSRSLVREIKVSPRPGWVRNDGSSPIALLEQLNALREENRALSEAAAVADEAEIDSTLEQGTDRVELWGERRVRPSDSYASLDADWSTMVTYDDIFRDIGPVLINEATEAELKRIFARFALLEEVAEGYAAWGQEAIAPEAWNAVMVQFRALGLIQQGTKKRAVSDRNSYWALTPLGDRHLVSLLARKRPVPTDDVVSNLVG